MSIFVFPFNYTHTVCDTKLPFTCAHTYFPTIECLFNEAPISCTFDKRMKSTTHQAPTPKYFVSVCRVKKRNSEVVLLVEICGILSFHHWTFQHTDKKTSTFYFHMKSSKTFPLNSNPCEQILSCQFGPSGKAKFEACQHIAPAQEPSERGIKNIQFSFTIDKPKGSGSKTTPFECGEKVTNMWWRCDGSVTENYLTQNVLWPFLWGKVKNLNVPTHLVLWLHSCYTFLSMIFVLSLRLTLLAGITQRKDGIQGRKWETSDTRLETTALGTIVH